MSEADFRYSRATVVAGARVLGDRAHTDLDDLLLEWGVADLAAGRELGSRAQRGVAIGSYAVSHPEAKTAEGQGLTDALVEAAFKDCIRWVDVRGGVEAERRHAFVRSLPEDLRSALTDPIELSSPVAGAGLPSDEPPAASAMQGRSEVSSGTERRVFLVHGRDEAAKNEVTLFLERLGLEVVILHEQPNGGRTLLTKFIEEASSARFAVVIMTGDDQGRLAAAKSQPPQLRARQNVVFELGFFIGLIGPANVCALVDANVERPSDFEAVAYIAFGAGTYWKQELAKELHHAGLPIKAEALLR